MQRVLTSNEAGISLHPGIPDDLYTGGNGPNRRIRVDVGQTGFFAGKEFRTFRELNLTNAELLVVRAVVPINIILFGIDISLLEGEIRLETVVGGTPTGTWAEVLPIFPRNTMSERPLPLYTQQTVITAGGSHTGGTVLDVLLNKTATNSNFAASVGSETSDERGIGAGTYYFRLTATGVTRGLFKARWEERP